MLSAEVSHFTIKFLKILNFAASGQAPPSLAPLFMSAPLTALIKKDDTNRPIAVGEVLRRLISKIAHKKVLGKAMAHLLPLQVGVGVRNGCESILHGFNALISHPEILSNPDILEYNNSTACLFDFKGAFQNIKRQEFFDTLKTLAPEILPWVQFSYSCKAILFFGSYTIETSIGVQQGDPLGPLLFALAAHPLLLRLHDISPNVAGYLDDITVLSPSPEIAVKCFQLVDTEGPAIGLFLNRTKSALWMPHDPVEALNCDWGGVEATIVTTKGVELLGSALSKDVKFLEQVALKKVEKCCTSITKMLRLNDPQLCYVLLRSCLGMSKLNYCWRTIPPEALKSSSALLEACLKNALRWICVGDGPGFGEYQILQASLPTHMNGLGITLPSDSLTFSFCSETIFKEINTRFSYFTARLDITGMKTANNCKKNLLKPLGKHQYWISRIFYSSKLRQLKVHPYLTQHIYWLFSSTLNAIGLSFAIIP